MGLTSMELSGKRDELKRWQEGEAQVLAVQIDAGSEGVDFTRARYSIFYSVGFSLGKYDQAKKRTHRPGQIKPVTHIHLVAQGHGGREDHARSRKARGHRERDPRGDQELSQEQDGRMDDSKGEGIRVPRKAQGRALRRTEGGRAGLEELWSASSWTRWSTRASTR